jgi:hydroxymethylglutaryl-CoA lyase
MPSEISIVEVGPRDGLQDVPVIVSTPDKLRLIDALLLAGLRRAEVVSFADPRRVPQMADAEAVVAGLRGRDADLIGLVLNDRGLDRAIECGIRSINTVVIVTDSFSRRNQGTTTGESLAMSGRVTAAARAAGMRTGVTLSAAFGCPFDGRVEPARVLELAAAVESAGADELSLADTIGVAEPAQTEDLIAAVRARVGVPIRVHLHDRHGQGLDNAIAAIRGGASTIDASLGGLGGCPFAPDAAGNISTEALVDRLSALGIRTGVDRELLHAAAQIAREVTGDHDRQSG